MALGDAIAGAVHTPQTITWKNSDGGAWSLSGGTLSGKIIGVASSSASRSIVGTLTFVTDGTDGVFRWTYNVDDVVAGSYYVQFKCTYADTTYDLTAKMRFKVLPAIGS